MYVTAWLLLAHDIGVPHEEVARAKDGSAGVLVIGAVVVVSALVLAGLLVLRSRIDRGDGTSRASGS